MSTGVERTVEKTSIEQLIDLLTTRRERPVYLQILEGENGKLECRQIAFLTPEQLADLAHVEIRTVYSWIEKAQENGLKFYRAPGTRGVLFEINEVLEWIRNAV